MSARIVHLAPTATLRGTAALCGYILTGEEPHADDSACARCREIAVALAWIATDATTKTPARLDENGPWWKATMADSPTVTVHVRPACPDHPRHQSLGCPECAAQVGDADSGLAAVRAAIRRTR